MQGWEWQSVSGGGRKCRGTEVPGEEVGFQWISTAFTFP